MQKFRRSSVVCLLAVGVLVLAGTSQAQSRAPILDDIAKTYGLDSFANVEGIRYTWNAEITGLFKTSHVWEWEPKTGKVSFEGTDKDGKPVKVSYVRSELGNAPANVKEVVEPSFVNDNYWLLFPLHAYWDKSATVTDEGAQKLPLGKGTADKVVVKYPAEAGGFTPGDTWELFVGKDKRVEEFVYRRGGDKKPSLVTATWVAYKKAGGLLFSTDHRGTADGKPLHISITNIEVKVSGSDKWIKAE